MWSFGEGTVVYDARSYTIQAISCEVGHSLIRFKIRITLSKSKSQPSTHYSYIIRLKK